jgi:hypothetical protein
MPSFSLPGTSIGTEEAERYLIRRQQGASRRRAAEELLSKGLSGCYAKQLERMTEVAVFRAKALFPSAADPTLWGLAWIQAVCGQADRPLFALNRFSLKRGFNAPCFCRSSILLFDRKRIKERISHNVGSTAGDAAFIDSG